MKEQKLIEMMNKVNKLDDIMQQVIQEMYNLKKPFGGYTRNHQENEGV